MDGNGRKEWVWYPPFHDCPINYQCLRLKNQNEKKKIELLWNSLSFKFCKVVGIQQKSKPIQTYYLLSKAKLQNSTFNSRANVINLSKGTKGKPFTTILETSTCFLGFFSIRDWKNFITKAGISLFVIIAK